jgi:hypothetical protein
MPGTGLQLTFDLVLYLGRHSYLEAPYQFRNRSRSHLDTAMDVLLEVATATKEKQPGFRPQRVADALRCEIEFLAETEVQTYFAKSFNLLSSWLPEPSKAYAEEVQNEIMARISKAHKVQEKRLEVYALDQKCPMPDCLGGKRVEFFEDVSALGQKVEGVLPAIDLLIHLGECSYPRKELCGPLYGRSMKKNMSRCEFDKEG